MFFFFVSLCFVSFAFASLVLCSETGCVCCVALALARLWIWRGRGGDEEEEEGGEESAEAAWERESQPCFTLSAMAASACVASSLAVSTSSSLRSSFVRPCSFRERKYAESRFLAAGRCVAQMAMPKLAEAFQSGYGYSIFFFPLFFISCSRPSTSVFQILYDLWRSCSAAAHFVFVSSWLIFCAWREGGSLYTEAYQKIKMRRRSLTFYRIRKRDWRRNSWCGACTVVLRYSLRYDQ
jgi:hypothetical protein